MCANSLNKNGTTLFSQYLVTESNLVPVSMFIGFLIETIHQDLASVAADVGYANHCQDGPVAAVVDTVR